MKVPNKIFVKWESYANDEKPSLIASTSKSELAEKDEAVVIGEYKLVRTSTITLKPVETNSENHQ